MRKIAVFLSKGGVGKTTTAVNLAVGLARLGAKVLLIDTDTQGQVSTLLGIKPAAGLAEVLATGLRPEVALVEAREGLWVLAGGKGLAGVKRQIARQGSGGERVLSKLLAPLEGLYDYVVVDTAPGWDTLNINVLFYVQELLIPVSLETLALQSLQDLHESLDAIQRYHRKLEVKYVLPTFLDRRVKRSQEILEKLKMSYGQQLCSPIRYSVRLSEAASYGQTIYEYAPRSPGAKDYEKLTEQVAQG